MARLTRQARARRYLQASLESGFTGLPAEHRRAKQSLMREHERAYSGVRAHALAGSSRHFDEPLTAGEKEHQRALRRQEGMQQGDVERIQREQLDEQRQAAQGRPQSRGESREESRAERAAAGAAGATSASLGSLIPGGGGTVMYAIGLMLGLSLIYLLVAGKGAGVITGITGVVVGAVRAFIAPVDPVAHLEGVLGAGPITAASAAAVAPSPGGPGTTLATPGAAGGFAPKGASVGLRRKDQGHDVQLAPGAALVAPGAGTVLRVASDPSGFGPDYPIVHFASGRYAGRDVYLGHVDSALKAGASFLQGTVLAHTSKTGHNAPPGWAEIGYAPGGNPGPFGQPSPF